MSREDRGCATCYWWDKHENEVYGWCCRYPPLVVPQASEEQPHGTAWPETHYTDWCGEWTSNADKQHVAKMEAK